MFYSIKRIKLLLVFLGLSIFTILSVAPYFFGPGLTTAVPVGEFLNSNFPDLTLSAQPYRPAFPNLTFDSPLTFANVPNSNVLVVGQRNGEIYWFDNDETVTSKNLMADLSDRVGMVWDGGFLGLAIHPEFGTPGNNYFYTYYTSKDSLGNDLPNSFSTGFGCYREDYWGGFLYLRRYEVDPVTFDLDVNSELTMIKLRMFSCTHRGGSMDFGNDGFLYLTTGEQSAYMKPQDISTNLDGGVLRIDVNQNPALSHPPIRTLDTGRFADEISGVGYYIPNDNPFVDPSGSVFEEYYTLGHRNPHRMTKDTETGVFYIGEVGENTHEEINVVKPGKNYGWPMYEGYVTGPGDNCGDMYNNMPHEGPLVAFPRSEANAIIGGYVYRGTSMPDLYGKYICADYGYGEEIWSVDINTGEYELITSFSPTDIMSFGEDGNGELYLLSQGDGVFLYRLTQVNESPHDSAPQLLSETGAFQDLETLTPNPGVIPYDLIESFWSDGAEKKRWMVIPNDGTHDTPQEKISFSEDGDWEFPVGSVLIKHFEMLIDESDPSITKRLETRFSIKASTGHFYFLTYKWNEDETDAVLLDSRLEENIQITQTDGSTRNQTWTYPGNPDCISCHNPATKGTLGPRTRYLNSEISYPTTGLEANQLVTLSHIGILDETIDDNTVLGYQTYKALDDPNATLDEKARSYLDLNCAYCHRPGGTGERAQFDLRLSNSLVETGLMYAGTNTPIGVPGERIVIAGDADNSILYHRTESVDQSIAMPPIAKNVMDQAGVDLVYEWINQLDPNYEDPTIRNSTYIVTNVGSGLVMDINGVSQANLADVHQWTYGGGDNQKFIIESAGGIYYTLKAVHSNKNIDVEAQGQQPGTNVIQYQENGTDAQLFSFEYLGNNQYAIKSKANNLYLGIENNSLVNGGSIKTYENDGSDFFKWGFTDLLYEPVTGVAVTPETASVFIDETYMLTASVLPENATVQDVIWSSSDESIAIVNSVGVVTGINEGTVTITATTVEGSFTDSAQITVYEGSSLPASTYTITNVGSNLVMDIFDASLDNFVNVIQWPNNLTENQQFIVEPAGGNYYTIKAVHSNKNVDVEYAGQDPGTELIQHDENGTDAQLFSFEYLGDGTYAIRSKVNGLYLGIEGDSDNAGANIVTNPINSSDYFKWGFKDLLYCNGTIVDHTDPVGTGTILASGEINEAENRFKAFDNKNTAGDFSKWLDNAGVPTEANPSYISIEFNDPKLVTELIITSANDVPDRDPENFKILGSNGGAFTELGSWANEVFPSRYLSRSFRFDNSTPYTIYRLEITKNLGNLGMTQLSEIELIGCDSPDGVLYTYDNGWSPEDPTGISNIYDSIVINTGEAIISSNTVCDDITVNPGATLTINTGVTMTANTTTLTSTSESYSNLILDGTIEGIVKYERYTNVIGTSAGGGNDLISAPLANIEFGPFAAENASNLAASGDIRAFAPYNTSAGAYQNYNVTANATTELASGVGYRAATTDGSNLIFTGDVPTGEVTIGITDAAAGYAWNLIGNPYPSYLDFSEFFDDNHEKFQSGGAFQAIYGYTGNSGEWTTWNYATIADPSINNLLTPGQAFFVKSKTDGAVVSFKPTMRKIGSSDDFILGRASNANFASTKLYLNSGASISSTQIYFIEGTTRGLDAGYDASSFMDNAAEFSIYSNLVDDNTGEDLSIQSLPYEDLSDVIVPLGVNAPAAVELTIGISDLSTYPENTNIYLEDRLENTFTLLNETEYVFTPILDLNGTGRFYLHYTNTVLSVGQIELDNLRIYTTANPKSLVVKGELTAASTINLYDIHGRVVLTQKLDQYQVLNTVDISRIGTGVYFAKVFNDNQVKTQKLIIK
ncbi:putative repeat protein (TIGR03806 family) [Winogradskyella epiphytica]|uniref:Putative repeat protein (TIGR03806 family) n=1 Tax=Winogradskyella epiphytica TaxID=262005 RepID=A0A2V4WU13_9FLAO|nr:RICIN domain-containing protein [Winogradskyella epiphytica]PYE79613.1 putative repeat protein (TIGR03806 family) [Winogradskyella epiphytica]GGW73964.1 hypothetical protein GCM10008085_27660 [Winogradskyella epiphytica]